MYVLPAFLGVQLMNSGTPGHIVSADMRSLDQPLLFGKYLVSKTNYGAISLHGQIFGKFSTKWLSVGKNNDDRYNYIPIRFFRVLLYE